MRALLKRRLRPSEMYPAGVPGVEVRDVRVRTGVRLRVLSSGPEDGNPVMLLHGWAACSYMHRHALRELADAGFRAYAVDMRGHGLSDKPVGEGMYTTERLLDDVTAVMESLGLTKLALAGQSMGGGLALRYALQRPADVTRLVLMSPAGLYPIPSARLAASASPRAIDRVARVLVPRWLVTTILRMTYGDPARVTEREIDEYWAPSQFVEYARAMRALLREFDWEPLPDSELAKLEVPTLLFVGLLDRLIPYGRNRAERLPDARVVTIEKGGHNLNEEFHERVNREIIRFLRSPSAS